MSRLATASTSAGADARVGEDELDHDDAARHPGQLQRGDLDRRHDRVRHGVAPDHRPLRQPLQARHRHVLGLEHLDHRAAHDAADVGRRRRARASPPAAPPPPASSHACVAGRQQRDRREPVEHARREQQDHEPDADHELRQRGEHERDGRADVVDRRGRASSPSRRRSRSTAGSRPPRRRARGTASCATRVATAARCTGCLGRGRGRRSCR